MIASLHISVDAVYHNVITFQGSVSTKTAHSLQVGVKRGKINKLAIDLASQFFFPPSLTNTKEWQPLKCWNLAEKRRIWWKRQRSLLFVVWWRGGIIVERSNWIQSFKIERAYYRTWHQRHMIPPNSNWFIFLFEPEWPSRIFWAWQGENRYSKPSFRA